MCYALSSDEVASTMAQDSQQGGKELRKLWIAGEICRLRETKRRGRKCPRRKKTNLYRVRRNDEPLDKEKCVTDDSHVASRVKKKIIIIQRHGSYGACARKSGGRVSPTCTTCQDSGLIGPAWR